MRKWIYLVHLKSVLGRSILHYSPPPPPQKKKKQNKTKQKKLQLISTKKYIDTIKLILTKNVLFTQRGNCNKVPPKNLHKCNLFNSKLALAEIVSKEICRNILTCFDKYPMQQNKTYPCKVASYLKASWGSIPRKRSSPNFAS